MTRTLHEPIVNDPDYQFDCENCGHDRFFVYVDIDEGELYTVCEECEDSTLWLNYE